MKHRTTREGDEHVCSCGLRWDIDEDDPHYDRELPGMWDNSDLHAGLANNENDTAPCTIDSIKEMLND